MGMTVFFSGEKKPKTFTSLSHVTKASNSSSGWVMGTMSASAGEGSAKNLAVRVVRRANGIPGPEVFELAAAPMPECPPNGVVLRVLNAGVDPAMRGWLSTERNYATVPDGAVMHALGVGVVIGSRSADWQKGMAAYGWLGWQRYAAVPATALLWPADIEAAPPEAWINIFGLNGLTAWIGLAHLGKPKPGETVVVTTAAGGVGGVVGQLAAAAGVRAVGLAGGSEKVARATAQFGYAAAIDYRAPGDLAAAIAACCPDGIDVFFDNTAGPLADTIFPHLNNGARVIQCGTASVASWLPPPRGPRRERDMLVKRLAWHGFVAFDHTDLFPTALAELRGLHAAGKLLSHDQVLEGLEHAPGAIQMLYRGENQGRLSIRP
jgi:NADPH-dependent curcumin reductase CurA